MDTVLAMDGGDALENDGDNLVKDSLEFDVKNCSTDVTASSRLEKSPRVSSPSRQSKRTHSVAKSSKPDNFINQNKVNTKRQTGTTSYAVLYAQKTRTMQGHAKSDAKVALVGKSEQEKIEAKVNNSHPDVSSGTSSELRDDSSCYIKHSNLGTYSNYKKGSYYNADDSTVYMQPVTGHDYKCFNNEYESCFNKPYQAPYSNFGLRYSNHGHQSDQQNYVFYPQHHIHDTNVYAKPQGYSSQSAPPGIPWYGQQQTLINQLDCLPEQNHLLFQSLTHSQFINPHQVYQKNSVLEKNFSSEPHLSNVAQPLAGQYNTDRTSQNKTFGGPSISLHQPVDYKPYTMKDYRQIKNEQIDMLGSLGPDTESEGYKEKITKLNKQREYAEILRIEHAAKKKQWERRAAAASAPARQLQAEAKRQAAINYAKTIPKPKLMESRQHKDSQQHEEKELTLIELLKIRHEKEKNKVEAYNYKGNDL